MKGDEMENKKIGGSVNLMVKQPWSFKTHLGTFWTESFNLLFSVLLEQQNFYKSEVNKEDMYIRYIHKLCDLHLQAEDFTGNGQMGDVFTFYFSFYMAWFHNLVLLFFLRTILKINIMLKQERRLVRENPDVWS